MKDNNLKNENINLKNIVGTIVTIIVAIIVLVLLVVVYNSFFNKNIYVDLNDPELVETKDGYKKNIDFETIVDKKEVINENNGKKYVITCYDNKEEYEIKIGNYLYNHLDVGEKIRVFGTIYYNEKGLRLSYDYQVESLEDDDGNGVIDIPDDYKEPEPERVPGVDYGDGVVW